MTPDDVIKKMTKRVNRIEMNWDEMVAHSKALVTACTEDGTHLIECDNDGFCMSCGYQETIEDFNN